MKQTWKRIGSLLLTVCMVFTLLPTMAFAETGVTDSGTPLGISGEITAFADLDTEVAQQAVETGTPEDALKLPDTLAVTVAENGDETATGSDARKEIKTAVAVERWTSDPVYDGDTAGDYTFTPTLALPEGLTLTEDVSAPTITVTVREESAAPKARGMAVPLGVGTITGTMSVGGTTVSDLTEDANGTGWAWDAASATLTLGSTYGGDGIYFNTTDAVNLTLEDDVSISTTGIDHGIKSEGNLTIDTGSHTLDVTEAHSGSPAFAIRTAGALTIGGSGTVYATHGGTTYYGTAIYAIQGVTVTDSVNVTASATHNGSGISSGSTGSIVITGNSKVTAAAKSMGGSGLYATNGTITISGSAEVTASNADNFAIISRGNLVISDSANVNPSGISDSDIVSYSDITINTTGTVTAIAPSGESNGAISANGEILLQNGTVTATNTAENGNGIKAESGISITDGTITATAQGTGYALKTIDEGASVRIGGGTVILVNSDTPANLISAPGGLLHTGGTLNGDAPAAAGITTETDLITALESATPSIITLGGSITLSTQTANMGASHTIDTGSFTLTISGGETYSTGGRIGLGTHTLTLKGTADIDSVQGIRSANGTLNLEDVTVKLKIANSIYAGTVHVNSGATVNLDSSRSGMLGGALLTLPDSTYSLNVNSGGVVNILDANGSGINNSSGGMININSGGTISVGAIRSDNWGINQQDSGGLKLNTGGTLDGIAGGAVFLNTGTKVDGMNGKFIDQGTALTATGEVTVGATDATPTNGGLSAGLYVWNGSAFAKAGGGTPSSNANLASLTVNAGTLSPVFDPSVTSYSVSVGYSTASITIGATAEAGATISGGQMHGLNVGVNTIPVVVTAVDGVTTKTYTVTVTRAAYSGGGSGGSGDSGGGGGYTPPTVITPIVTEKQPDTPTTAKASVSGTVKEGTLSATITEQMVKDAIKAAQDAAEKSGKKVDGIALDFNVTGNSSYTNQNATMDAGAIDLLKESGVKFIKIGSAVLDVTLDMGAITEIDKQSTGTVTVSAKRMTNLSAAAQKLIDNRPAFDITVSYQKNGKTEYVSSFGKGAVTLGIAYKATDKENKGNLFGVYVDKEGKPQLLTNSSYDNTGRLILSRNSLSTYGVGYKAPAPAFTDTAKHWAKDNIDFVASRDLISGTSATTFAPDTAITRADFLMALGRLSGADVSIYNASSFTDVKSTDTAMPYIEWAVKNKIVSGYGNGKFGPNDSITREQMAVMMAGYAKATGHKLPVSRQIITFADDAKISAYAKDAVKVIQQTGVINGKDGNRFDPQGNATRAEASTILRRFVELVIDEGTARGWVQNDVGQWQYVGDNGKPVVGWLTVENGKYHYYFTADGIMVSGKWLEIDSKWYYFNTDGSLARSTKIDGYEVDENGVRKTM
ncbi:S-layer homology domain-containing protein [Lacrimispora sp.]|uniref:S-layer homology domain-containing protein n=1 Tax=Lacrimispora sp. TaxID=2719234 RepID=UPI00289B1966|nr:S-layer homology domain-containing protein [Lacrimispora sp.]